MPPSFHTIPKVEKPKLNYHQAPKKPYHQPTVLWSVRINNRLDFVRCIVRYMMNDIPMFVSDIMNDQETVSRGFY